MVFTLLHAKMTGNLSIYFLSFVPIFLYTLITFSIDGLTTAKSNPDSSNFGWFLVISGARLVISMVCFFTAFLVYRITTRNKRNQVATNDSQA
jgi:ABC-type multidrug transport system fused ATPase/permease subunit